MHPYSMPEPVNARNAARSDDEHAARLNSCASYFADVMTVHAAIGRIAVPVAARRTA